MKKLTFALRSLWYTVMIIVCVIGIGAFINEYRDALAKIGVVFLFVIGFLAFWYLVASFMDKNNE